LILILDNNYFIAEIIDICELTRDGERKENGEKHGQVILVETEIMRENCHYR
jgi:hypothetical protein